MWVSRKYQEWRLGDWREQLGDAVLLTEEEQTGEEEVLE